MSQQISGRAFGGFPESLDRRVAIAGSWVTIWTGNFAGTQSGSGRNRLRSRLGALTGPPG